MGSSNKPISSSNANSGSGNQYVSAGTGSQFVTEGSQYNDLRHVVNNYYQGEIPSIHRLERTGHLEQTDSNEPTNIDISNWLARHPKYSPLDSRHHLIEYQTQQTDDTGHWLLQTPEYREWVRPLGPFRTLALTGILGSGKSTLASLMIEAIQREARLDRHVACAYFYFQRGGEAYSEGRVWASLLEQLLQHQAQRPAVSPEVVALYNQSLRGIAPPHRSEYWKLFEAQAKMFNTVYLVLDALDCYFQTDQLFFQSLRKLPSSVKLAFTSRLDHFDYFSADCMVRIEPVESDIRKFIHGQIDGSSTLRLILKTEGDKSKVTEAVTKVAMTSKMFLLAKLHMNKLKTCDTLNQIMDTLRHLAQSSDLVFEEYISAISTNQNRDFEHLARHVLTWVVHAKTPLTVHQVIDSFAIERSNGQDYQMYRVDQSTVVSMCEGLVILDPKGDTLKLVHESVQGSLKSAQILYGDADFLIAKNCLACLCLDKPDGERTGGDTVLLSYAAKFWVSHLAGYDYGRSDAPAIKEKIQEFLSRGDLLERAFRSFRAFEDGGFNLAGMTGVHAVVYYNQHDWAHELQRRETDLDAQCEDAQTALHWAVRLGRVAMVKYLVNMEANINIPDEEGQTPLHIVLTKPVEGDIVIAKALLKGGARADIPNRKGRSALELAVKYGPTKIAEMILKIPSNLNGEIRPGWTPLREIFYATSDDFGPSQQRSSESWKVLQLAFDRHVDHLFDYALDRGVQLNRPTRHGWLPLMETAKEGNMEWTTRLLTRKPEPADVNSRDKTGRSPLYWALQYKHPKLARLLLSHGARVNEDNIDGWTPLIQAARLDAKELVWSIVTRGPDINAVDKDRKSALDYAILNRSKDVIWLLLSHSTDLGIHGSRLLHSAMEHDDLSTAWLLCQHGADLDPPDADGLPPLHKACRDGNLRHVQFLLDHGARVGSPDLTSDGLAPLHHAVVAENDKILTLIASRASQDLKLELQMRRGDTALILATLQKRLSSVRILLEHGASCDSPGPGGRTALHIAARLGFHEGLRLMVARSNSPDLVDDLGYTALHHAVCGKTADTRTVNILTKNKMDLEVEEKRDAYTPLMLAASLGRFELVQQLLTEGASAFKINDRGKTVLDILDSPSQNKMQEVMMKNRLRGQKRVGR